MPKVNLSERTIAYSEAGSGAPILFLHGYPLSRSLWDQQISSLSRNYHLIAPDLRGHGESDPGTGPNTMEAMAQDCAGLLDQLHIHQPLVLCGLSMGGYVGFAFYKLFKERLAGLILASTRAANDSPQARQNREQVIRTVQSEGPEPVIASMVGKLLSQNTQQHQPGILAQAVSIMHSGISTQTIISDQLGMLQREDFTPMLSSIDLPVMVIHGSEDQIVPIAEAQQVQAAIPGSRLVMIPGAAHLANLEEADLFNQAAATFLKTII